VIRKLRVWRDIHLSGFTWSRLPMLKLRVLGRNHNFVFPSARSGECYDLVEDVVREQVCEPIRPDVYAMWSDARERWMPSTR
jgi:hypothetical protein